MPVSVGRLPSVKKTLKWSLMNVRDSVAYRSRRNERAPEEVHHLIFVCKGNICRSVFAEHYLRSKTHDPRLRIESCGLDVDQNCASPKEAIVVGGEFGLDLAGHLSRSYRRCDFAKADLILAMEYHHYLRLSALFPESGGRIRLLREFAPWPERYLCNINDPYGLGPEEFRRCFRAMQRALEGLRSHMTRAI